MANQALIQQLMERMAGTQSRAQGGLPVSPNNGNPNGAHNVSAMPWDYTGGQNPNLGRYRPPTMAGSGNDPMRWNDYGGYSYNAPNSFGRMPEFSGYGVLPGMGGSGGGPQIQALLTQLLGQLQMPQFPGMGNPPAQDMGATTRPTMPTRTGFPPGGYNPMPKPTPQTMTEVKPQDLGGMTRPVGPAGPGFQLPGGVTQAPSGGPTGERMLGTLLEELMGMTRRNPLGG